MNSADRDAQLEYLEAVLDGRRQVQLLDGPDAAPDTTCRTDGSVTGQVFGDLSPAGLSPAGLSPAGLSPAGLSPAGLSPAVDADHGMAAAIEAGSAAGPARSTSGRIRRVLRLATAPVRQAFKAASFVLLHPLRALVSVGTAVLVAGPVIAGVAWLGSLATSLVVPLAAGGVVVLVMVLRRPRTHP